MKPSQVRKLIKSAGGRVEKIGMITMEDGYALASFPLPKNHWIYSGTKHVPPAVLNKHVISESHTLIKDITRAARFAIRASTRNGKDMDFDPDAMVQNMVIGLLGCCRSTCICIPRSGK